MDAGGQLIAHPYQRSAPGLVSQDPTCNLDQDVLLETAANRSIPMECGSNVDQVTRHSDAR